MLTDRLWSGLKCIFVSRFDIDHGFIESMILGDITGSLVKRVKFCMDVIFELNLNILMIFNIGRILIFGMKLFRLFLMITNIFLVFETIIN